VIVEVAHAIAAVLRARINARVLLSAEQLGELAVLQQPAL
jgi:hypothetical protein